MKPVLIFLVTTLAGCSTMSDTARKTGEYSIYDSTQSFIALTDTRRNGAVVDKGLFYPKNTYSFSYRYCSSGEASAAKDIAEYQTLAKRVCDVNNGQLIHQDTGTWCVASPNTHDERPIFYARISSTELWADLCLDGPFVTLKLIENTTAPTQEWYESAQVLGYEPYSAVRLLVPRTEVATPLQQTPRVMNASHASGEESQYISSNVGTTVCLYSQQPSELSGFTYRGQVYSVKDGMIKVLVQQKLKGDIRSAPAMENVPWYDKAYITASANSWFVCT